MYLYLQQKVFSLLGKFFVKDENENDVYLVRGEFALGKRLRVYDYNDNEVAVVRQKVFSWLPRYIVEIDGVEVCRVVREFSFMRQSYRIEGLPWHLDGDIWAHEYALTDYGNNKNQIMHFTKKWFSWGDSYRIEIADPKDALVCLCIALAVDCAVEQAQSSSSS